MPENTFPSNDPRPPSAKRDRVVAWVCDGVACVYLAWLFGFHWRVAGVYASMFEGLGADLPLPTRFVIGQRTWLCPLLFLVLAGAVVGKERFVHDKRFSAMLTFLATLLGQGIAGILMDAYYLPMFDLIGKLS
jgi:hypothetical protein